MIKRVDEWLGKRVFQPPIIRVCQLTGITQYAFHRYAWLAVALYMVGNLKGGGNWLWAASVVFIGAVRVLESGLFADAPVKDHPTARRVIVTLAAIDTGLALLGYAYPISIIGAFAEYALTIKTIPPREVKPTVRRMAGARLGAGK